MRVHGDVVDQRAQIGSGAWRIRARPASTAVAAPHPIATAALRASAAADRSTMDYQFATNPRQFDRPPAKGDLGVVAAFSGPRPRQGGPAAVALCRDPAANALDAGGG